MSIKLKDDLATFLHDRGNQTILLSSDIAMSLSGSDTVLYYLHVTKRDIISIVQLTLYPACYLQ